MTLCGYIPQKGDGFYGVNICLSVVRDGWLRENHFTHIFFSSSPVSHSNLSKEKMSGYYIQYMSLVCMFDLLWFNGKCGKLTLCYSVYLSQTVSSLVGSSILPGNLELLHQQ